MKGFAKRNILIVVVMVCLGISCIGILQMDRVLNAQAEKASNRYAFTEGDKTFYSEESEDDAWYNAKLYQFENGLLTPEDIELEYSAFSRRSVTEEVYTQNNARNLTHVQGHIYWNTKDGFKLPLKNCKVELFSGFFGVRLLEGYTDLNGFYSFTLGRDLFIALELKNLFIRYYPQSDTFTVGRDWLFQNLIKYYIDSAPIKNIADGSTTNLELTILYDVDNMVNCAFYVSQGMEIAQRFAKTMGFSTSVNLRIMYPFPDKNIAFSFNGYSGIGKLNFDNFDTLMHEYGHFVENYLGTYGSNIFEISENDPDHESHKDHFEDKKDKDFAMNLTWSESWATVFALMGQQYYLSDYFGKVEGYGDIEDGTDYETYEPIADSCEAQEDAVTAFLWDLFDDSASENFDNIALGYTKWW